MDVYVRLDETYVTLKTCNLQANFHQQRGLEALVCSLYTHTGII